MRESVIEGEAEHHHHIIINVILNVITSGSASPVTAALRMSDTKRPASQPTLRETKDEHDKKERKRRLRRGLC